MHAIQTKVSLLKKKKKKKKEKKPNPYTPHSRRERGGGCEGGLSGARRHALGILMVIYNFCCLGVTQKNKCIKI